MHVTLTSPTVGLTAVYPCTTPTGPHDARWRGYRHGVKSAPAHARQRRLYPDRKLRSQPIGQRLPQTRPNVPPATRISLDDVVNMAEHAREVTSLQSRRLVLEEAQRALRYENSVLDRSRPHSVVGPGLQAYTSPMPSPSRSGQMDHIPSLLPLPSDRTFIPSPDQNHDRHVTTTPTEHFRLDDDDHHPVARQCCEIMGPSLCRSCRRLESRAQNRKSAELECPRMRSAGGRGRQTFSLTQVIKRSYPRLSDAEIQDKLARGEIAQLSFPWRPRSGRHDHDYDDDVDDDYTMRNSNGLGSGRSSLANKGHDSSDEDDEEEDDRDILHVDPATYRANTPSTRPDSGTVNYGSDHINADNTTGCSIRSTSDSRQHLTKASLSSKNAFYFLARLTMKLQGATTTPLFFSDLRRMQDKILSGTVDRKAYMTLRPNVAGSRQSQQDPPSRLKSAVSTTSTGSGKSGLSKLGSQLSREFMPAFVSPRKVKLIEEPKYKVYFEPPLLTKRRQIPNPSFFAGSNDEYSLPERLPDVIEFADSQRIAALEKQIRSGSALSFVSSVSEEQQQQLQASMGEQERLTSLPLDKGPDDAGGREGAGGDHRPTSSKGGVREGGVSTPTPRSTLRVSSGGPLSSRTVPEEDEEEVERELEASQQREKQSAVPEGNQTEELERDVRDNEEEQLVGENDVQNQQRGGDCKSTGEENSETCISNTSIQTRLNTVITDEAEKPGDLTVEAGVDQNNKHRLNEDNRQTVSDLNNDNPVVLEDKTLNPINEELDLESITSDAHQPVRSAGVTGDETLQSPQRSGVQGSPFFLTSHEPTGQLGSKTEENGQEKTLDSDRNSDTCNNRCDNGYPNASGSDDDTAENYIDENSAHGKTEDDVEKVDNDDSIIEEDDQVDTDEDDDDNDEGRYNTCEASDADQESP